jgi:hypothetical protein
MDLAVGPVLACGRYFISILGGEIPPGYTGWARQDPAQNS